MKNGLYEPFSAALALVSQPPHSYVVARAQRCAKRSKNLCSEPFNEYRVIKSKDSSTQHFEDFYRLAGEISVSQLSTFISAQKHRKAA